METLAVMLAVSFVGLAALHLYWAFGGTFGMSAALPQVDGAPLFTPRLVGTVALAFLFAGFALIALVLGFGAGSASVIVPCAEFFGFAVGGVLVLRAVGEFRYVGFFKRVKGSKFAVYDTWLFSPFCLLAGGAFLALAVGGA
ncbi:DUF3995 domain-containing protein [Desulfofustis glycolicus]|uniref:DUF3995 domain-containing protein n=1 Tax=Desulfofustis glycolicus DSM 9705 TaxID=1121409 RepID=A0A1M5YIV8_9BACT|nr:DUF3995 domain-containing protein [Desulfofustis glycolicus]MCB2218574.1 DUF3995 domain-containing protein [Desulfobulbaceae bacterium]SHI11874.1 Protein of unknown function [Desulfofustis glycolicus DSM 9705]